MNDPDKPSDDDREDEAVRSLLRRTLSTDAIAKGAPDLLPGVQRRLRMRSRGKFFGDGWSTTQTRLRYLMVAILTLLLVAMAYLTLGPMDVH